MTDIRKFEEFADDVRTAMALRYPDDRVELRRVTKNNGVIYTGIYLRITTDNIVEVKKKINMLRSQRVTVFILVILC